MADTAAPPTVGMQIDAVIARLQTVSTTQLYATVIAASLAFSFYLLNSGGSSALVIEEGHVDGSLRKPSPPREKKQLKRSSSAPEPKWHILKITNFVAAAGFLLSVLQFASNASTYLNDSTSLLQFLSVWSVFLCYFFGFFGISFIELDDFVDQPQPSQPLQTPVARKSHVDRCVVVTVHITYSYYYDGDIDLACSLSPHFDLTKHSLVPVASALSPQ